MSQSDHHHSHMADHHHDHEHDHTHGHSHGDPHGLGHNHSHDHMHSHVHIDPNKERFDRLQALAATFIEGFRKADDKPAFLELSRIPLKREGSDGLTMHLVEAALVSKWQMGTASPSFGSKELTYLAYPASMVQERETISFTYVSLTERVDLDLLDLLNTMEGE